MAPVNKNLKTYDRRGRKSVDVLNALLAQNLSKRLIGKKKSKKKKPKLRELPPKTKTYLSDDSLKVSMDDTFDKLLKGKVFNQVKVVKKFVKVNSSESDVSKSQIPQVSVSYHSPMMTRRRRKQSSVVITEIDKSSLKEGSLPAEKSSTLDKPVDVSLQVEKENKKLNFSSLSYIKLPKIVENKTLKSDPSSYTRMEASYEPIFSDTFRERQIVHSSTPCFRASTNKIVADSISPINMSTPDSKLIKRSYDEIKKWDSNYPSIDEKRTPPGPVLRSSTKKNSAVKVRRRKLSTVLNSDSKKKCEDWKLTCQPKVFFKRGDIIDFKKVAQPDSSDESVDNLKGFTDLEKSKSTELSNEMKCAIDTSTFKDKSKNETEKNFVKRLTRRTHKLMQSKKDTLKRKSENENKNTNSSSSQKPNKKSKISKKPTVSTQVTLRITRSMKKRFGKSSNKSISVSERIKKRTVDEAKRKIDDSDGEDYVTPLKKIVRSKDVSKGKLHTKTSTKNVNAFLPMTSTTSASPSSPSNKSSGVSYCCEDLSRDLEVNLPNVNKETNEVTSSKNLSVDLKEFDTFMAKYNSEKKTDELATPNTTKEESNENIISISDTSTADSVVYTCADSTNANKESPLSENTSLGAKQLSPVVNKTSSVISPKLSPRQSARRAAKNFTLLKNQTSPKTSTPRRSNVVILNNVLLHSSNSETFNESLKIYRNICHDHSYSSSPVPKLFKPLLISPRRVETKNQSGELQLSDIIESSVSDSMNVPNVNKDWNNVSSKYEVDKKRRKSITLKSGKSYRRCLSLLRRSSVIVNDINSEKCRSGCTCLNCLLKEKLSQAKPRRTSVVLPVNPEESLTNQTVLEAYARRHTSYVRESKKIIDLDESVGNLSLSLQRSALVLNNREDANLSLVTAKDVVLRKCGQTEILPFEKCYPRSALQHCQKIGEGVYGEVFLYRSQNGGTSVMKIIPIEGDLMVNGETQKKYEEIVTEIIISMELSNLRNGKVNCTSGFSEVKSVKCVQGCYPDQLLDLWQLYDENYGSENDSPQIFPPDQLYIILELANGGQDIESYVFNSALQVFSMFKQTACALAVAESQLKFEHRDLHWGNVLVTSVDKNKTLQFRLNGKEIEVQTHGVEVTIIDFTLSRVECDGVVIFNDLSLDNDLFSAKGDYQFEIYRLMQKSNGNNWEAFNPYSNVLWLHYLLDKAVTSALRFKNKNSKTHREYFGKLKKLHDRVLTFHSAVDFVLNTFV